MEANRPIDWALRGDEIQRARPHDDAEDKTEHNLRHRLALHEAGHERRDHPAQDDPEQRRRCVPPGVAFRSSGTTMRTSLEVLGARSVGWWTSAEGRLTEREGLVW